MNLLQGLDFSGMGTTDDNPVVANTVVGGATFSLRANNNIEDSNGTCFT